jgi:hypothetical protein
MQTFKGYHSGSDQKRKKKQKERKKRGTTACSRNLKIWVVKDDLSLFHSVLNKI